MERRVNAQVSYLTGRRIQKEIREPKKEMKRNAIKHFTEITFETELIPRSHRILWAHRKREKRWHIERKKRRQEGREEICRPSTVTRIKPGRHLKNGLQERKSSPLESTEIHYLSRVPTHLFIFWTARDVIIQFCDKNICNYLNSLRPRFLKSSNCLRI